MTEIDRLKADFEGFSADEKRALLAGLRAGAVTRAFVGHLAQARRRTQSRRRSDAETDRARRVLVGARVPRELYERCRECASARGISLYRFVNQALERELEQISKS